MHNENQKLVCPERQCNWHGWSYQALHASHPFGEPGTVTGCPKCKGVDVLVVACDEPGCWQEATCGAPVADGYRTTCGWHNPANGTNGCGASSCWSETKKKAIAAWNTRAYQSAIDAAVKAAVLAERDACADVCGNHEATATNTWGPPGTFGCECQRRNSLSCAELRFGYRDQQEQCECLCHNWQDDGDDDLTPNV